MEPHVWSLATWLKKKQRISIVVLVVQKLGRCKDTCSLPRPDELLNTLWQIILENNMAKYGNNTSGFSGKYGNIIYTLWKFNIAIEHGPFIVDSPIKHGDLPVRKL